MTDNPAPPPCEAYSAPIDDESEAPVLCLVHDRPIYICIEAKDAEIAELRAAIFHVTTWLEKGQIMYSPNFFILEFHHLLHSRALLAPKGDK